MNYRISDLKNFIESAGCRTLSEAAKKLEITQPALSESIKRLEQDLGHILFYRSRSGINLTPTGQMTFEKAKNALSAILNVESFENSENLFQGRLVTIGCHPMVASYFLPSALKYLAKKSSDYRVEIKHGLSRHIQDDIQKGLIDIGIVINPIPVPDLIIKTIAKDSIYIWTHEKEGVGNKLICSLDLFQSQSILRKAKSLPTEIIDTNSIELIVRLVSHNVGLGIIPERAVHLLKAPLKKLKDSPVFKDDICLVYRPEFGKNSFEKEVIESLKQSII